VAAAAEVASGDVPTGIDGCAVPTFALPLERMAHAFSRLERLAGGDRVAGAIRAHPDLIRGPTAADTILMRALPGWIAKGGAEGLLCAASPDGLGVALKVEDGATRAVQAASAAFLARLELDGSGRLETSVPLRNSHGDVVGAIAVE
jgi:L-asparaginase II